MSLNLLDLVKDQLTEGVIGKISSVIGGSTGATQSALSSFLPTLLSKVVDKGSTVGGSVNLLEMIKDKKLGSDTLSSLSSMLDNDDSTKSYMKKGKTLVSSLFGKDESSSLDKLSSLTGLESNTSSGLMSMLAPIAMLAIGKIVKRDNLDGSGLHKLLTDQKLMLSGLLPTGLGFASGDYKEPVASKTTTHVRHDDDSSGGGGWWKWLLGLAILGGLLWFLMRGCENRDHGTTSQNTEKGDHTTANGTHDDEHAGGDVSSSGNTTTVVYSIDPRGNLVDGAGKVIQNAGDFMRDAAGNIVDKAGNIVVRAGTFGNDLLAKLPTVKGGVTSIGSDTDAKVNQFAKDAKGNLIDAKGKIVYKVGEYTEKDGEFFDKEGKKIGFFGKIGEVIGDVAGAVATPFVKVFGGLFSKKEKIGTTHSLTRVQFDSESHRITYYSKPEVEGMVAALKQYPDAKIEVQVYTNDGKNSKENNKLTDLRAKVLHDMIVTLGVKDSQISHKGMGDSDAAKAKADKVDILVEQTVNK